MLIVTRAVYNVIYALKSNGTATVVNIDDKCLDAKILEKVEFNNQDYPVTTIGEYAGSYCIFENIVIPNSIELIKKEGNARRGKFITPHGIIQTPVFMNVATAGAIKGAVSAEDLKENILKIIETFKEASEEDEEIKFSCEL